MIVGKKHQVCFRLHLEGNKDVPQVKVVVCTSEHDLAFKAVPVDTAGTYAAEVCLPPSVVPGTYQMKIEVITNGRHFTPVNRTIEVEADVEQDSKVDEPYSEPTGTTDSSTQPVAEPPENVVNTPASRIDILRSFEKVNNSDYSASNNSADAALAPVEMPKPKVSLPVDLFKFAFAKLPESKNVTPVALKTAPLPKLQKTESLISKSKGTRTIIEMKKEIPVVLTKGGIVYE
jgi:hypothetical protein